MTVSLAPPPEVVRLFARHGLGEVRSVVPLGGGLNTALRVNDRFVLRYREAQRSTGSLRRDAAILRRLKGRVPVPEVHACGLDDLLGEYVIQEYAPGRPLLQAWLDNPEVAAREWWLTQWIGVLHAVHEERFPRPGDLPEGQLRAQNTWRGYIEARIRKRLDLILRVPSLDKDLVVASERYLRRHAAALTDGPFCLIHRDLHFGNVIVDGPHLTAVLDFELAESGPPDYELDTIYRFLQNPGLFVAPGRSTRVSPSRFASVWVRLRRGYPALFAVPHLRERLSLYALDHALSCLIQACGGPWNGDAAISAALSRIREILQGRYGPE